jgi:hypothetical protein
MLPGFENPYVLGINLIAFGFFAVCLFLVLRQFVLWYWRLNQIADDLDQVASDMAELKADLHVIATYYRNEMARIHLKPVTPTPSPAGHAPAPRPTRPALAP